MNRISSEERQEIIQIFFNDYYYCNKCPKLLWISSLKFLKNSLNAGDWKRITHKDYTRVNTYLDLEKLLFNLPDYFEGIVYEENFIDAEASIIEQLTRDFREIQEFIVDKIKKTW